MLTVPQESKLSLWGGRAKCEKPHEENPHPGSHAGKISAWGYKGGGRPGPPPAIAFMALIPQPRAQDHGCGRGEWLQSDLTNWVEECVCVCGGGGQRGLRQETRKTLLSGPAWLRPHDCAAASPNISFHGNPGEKRGAFILASEFTLLERRRHQHHQAICWGCG